MAVHWMFSADKAPLGSQSFSNQGSWLASTFNLSAEGGAQPVSYTHLTLPTKA